MKNNNIEMQFFRSARLGRQLLVGETGVRVEAEFVQCGVAGEVDHGRWATEQHTGIFLGGKQVGGNHVLIDEANAVRPT